MAKSTGIVLTATAISFGNEWLTADKINFRIPVAGLGVAFLFDGIERISPRAGIGLAYIMLITVMVTPFNGKSPLQTLGMVASNKASSVTTGARGDVAVIKPPNSAGVPHAI